MDRQGISSPVFHDNDDANNYITKMPIFGLQRAMRGIERLTADIHQREARTRDYIDTKLAEQRDQVRDMLANYKSPYPSSSSRRRRSSRKSSERPHDESTMRHHHHLRDDRKPKAYGDEEHYRLQQHRHHREEATATTTTSASSPSVIKASSPLDVRHLRLPPTSTPTSAFIDRDGDEMIEHGIFPSVMEESDDVPSSAFIHGYDDEMVEHGIFLRPQ